MDEKEIHDFEKTFPIGHESIPPQNKHMAVAIFEAIKQLFENKSSIADGSFTSLALEIFERKRKASFVPDMIAFQKYEDRLGSGFYSSKEGETLIRHYLLAESGAEGPAKA